MQKPPFKLCAQCDAALIAPIWAEHLDDRPVRNLWSCETCGYLFESVVYFPLSKKRNQTQAIGSIPIGPAMLTDRSDLECV
jgi:hypothetical protein